MRLAISLALQAKALNEVPVGAIIVADGKIIASGFNLRETTRKATAHAELLAIEEASLIRGSWRLNNCDLFVTLEPCLMCAGVIYQARLRRVVFGALDPKAGALGSLYKVHEDQRLNHRYIAQGGILETECGTLLRSFFAEKRKSK